jgi:flagellar hook-basal body complex protein FliE
MSGIEGISASRVLAMRAQILERNQALSRGSEAASVGGVDSTAKAGGADLAGGFGAKLESALKAVNATQDEAGKLSAAYERGDNIDVAQVMLSRQKASISFEATLQVRNKLLSAYKDIMSMPV